MKKILGCLIVFTILLQPLITIAANYVLSNQSELSFDIDFEKHLYNATVTKYIDPETNKENVYAKITNTKVVSFTCNGHNIALGNNTIKDGYIHTKNYGKMKIGLFGYPPTVRVWLTKTQLRALKELKPKRK